jgi:N-glycosylase/DNA lyase
VTIHILFMSPEGGSLQWDEVPREMSGHGSIAEWPNATILDSIPDFNENGQARWQSFVEHFKLKNVDDLNADFAKKSMYFLPTCEGEERAGLTGGENYGILAEIPVLVE